MKWRFVDRVAEYSPWKSIYGGKAVSFEEYCLLEPLGRTGEFPRSLLIECAVELSSWLVAVSTGFKSVCVLGGMDCFETQPTGPASVIDIKIAFDEIDGDKIAANAELSDSGEVVGRGTLTLLMSPLSEFADSDNMEQIWRELYAEA